jgi:co-chaperonin GroES (HSP10)
LERNLEVAKGNEGSPAGPTEFKKVVQLSPGENRIVVIAKSKSNQTSNQIVVNRRVPPAVSKPRLHVVAVGVSEYQDDKLNLQFAAKDAVDFVAAMSAQRQRGRFSEEGVSITLVNKDANTKTILRELEQLHTQVSEGDLLVMLLAGHGIHDKQRNYFFATHDAETSSPNASCVSWA